MLRRLVTSNELSEVRSMLAAHCPTETNYDFADETVFIWERKAGDLAMSRED